MSVLEVTAVLSAGVGVVLITMLVLKLHAFLALLLAALTVAALTPTSARREAALNQQGVAAEIADRSDGRISLQGNVDGRIAELDRVMLLPKPAIGDEVTPLPAVVRTVAQGSGRTSEEILLELENLDDSAHVDDLSGEVWMIQRSQWREIAADLAVPIGQRLAVEFGETTGKIGLLIAMAAVIGKCLLASGGAERVVRSSVRFLGEERAPVAFVVSGFLLGIPVFFDTVFYLMIPLGKALAVRSERNYLLYVLTIVCGGTMAHSLVPPTPGPLLVASELGVNIGTMIVAGTVLGSWTALVGLLVSKWMNRRSSLPLRDTIDLTRADLEKVLNRRDDELPSLFASTLPILLPVALIVMKITLAGSAWLEQFPLAAAAVDQLGDKTMALIIAAAVAIVLLVRQKRDDLASLEKALGTALASGGVIILITAAGGTFGAMLQETGVTELIRELPVMSPAILVSVAFGITTLIRTAQGSATVAMITAVGILGGIASSGAMACHPVYVALAIGCGSKPFAWMNDSGFWVITRMSGMTETEGLKFITPMSAAMGFSGLFALIIAATAFPMVG